MKKKQLKAHSKTKQRTMKQENYAPIPPGGRKFNADEFLKAVEKLKKLLLKNNPRRFEEEDFIHV